MAGWIVFVVLGLGLLGCQTVSEGRDGTEELRLNDIQVLGSHNSYKQAIDPLLYEFLLRERDADTIRTLEYAHISLTEQLDLGLRKLELDVFYDPEGGRYAEPAGLRLAGEEGIEPYDSLGEMTAPGFKVLHVQDIDFRSSCLTLAGCLGELRAWSDEHPRHLPIVVTMNAKDSVIEGFVEPLPFDEAALDALDQEIFGALEGERLLVPDDVRGDSETLREAILGGNWPLLEDARGRFLFVLDEGGEKRERYVHDHPSLAGRVMFTNSPPEDPEAAFLIINNPLTDGERIRSLVLEGFLVRTRADANTLEARAGDTSRRLAAFASGAHFISTDYYRPNPVFGTAYWVELPGGAIAICNPARQPDCGAIE